MKKTARYSAVGLVLLFGVGVGVISSRWTRKQVEGVQVPFYATGQHVYGEILVRDETAEGESFLIALVSENDLRPALYGTGPLVPTGPVYRFVPKSARIDVSSTGAWNAAKGKVSVALLDSTEPSDPIHRDGSTDTLSFEGKPVQTSGPYALTVGVSPDAEYVSVISAHGRRRGGLGFFGGGYPNGPYYHELFKRVTGVKLGATYILEAPRRGVPLLACCWEEQGNYIVYHDSEGEHLWVVPGPNHPSNQVAPEPTLETGADSEEKNNE